VASTSIAHEPFSKNIIFADTPVFKRQFWDILDYYGRILGKKQKINIYLLKMGYELLL